LDFLATFFDLYAHCEEGQSPDEASYAVSKGKIVTIAATQSLVAFGSAQ
jgi:hypothetical protein